MLDVGILNLSDGQEGGSMGRLVSGICLKYGLLLSILPVSDETHGGPDFLAQRGL